MLEQTNSICLNFDQTWSASRGEEAKLVVIDIDVVIDNSHGLAF